MVVRNGKLYPKSHYSSAMPKKEGELDDFPLFLDNSLLGWTTCIWIKAEYLTCINLWVIIR
jgi:hypothetical protein